MRIACSESRCAWTPDPLKSKALKMLLVRGREVGDAVVAQGEGEAGVDDVAEAGGGFGGPVPDGLGDLGFLVAKLPRWIGTERIAEGRGLLGSLGFFKDRRVAKLHV